MKRYNPYYDGVHLLKCFVWMGIVFVAMKVTNGAGFVVVVPMVFFGLLLRKTESLFFWLLMAVCAVLVNPNLVPKGGVFAWIQRGLMLSLGGCMAISVLSHPIHAVLRTYVGIILYVIYMALSSANGWCPVVSYLKLLLFSFIYFAYLGVANQVGLNANVSSRGIRSIILSVIVLFVVGSVALLPFPNLSQLHGEAFLQAVAADNNITSLFMGMTNHSQCLGPVISCISVFLFADLLFSLKRVDPLYITLLAACPYLIYKTSSRTGMGAYLLGMMFVLHLFVNARSVGSRWKSRVFSSLMGIVALSLFVALCLPGVQDKVAQFVMKSSADQIGEVSVSGVMVTRQGKIDESLYHFKKRPMLGNGFQVSEEMKGLRIRDGAQLLSAPIEKGVWVTAVLEEGGVFGWVIFVWFLIACIVMSVKKRAYMGASCLFVFAMTNLGEFSFFSMSYTGGFCWAMVFAGLALDIKKLQDEEAAMLAQLRGRMAYDIMANN